MTFPVHPVESVEYEPPLRRRGLSCGPFVLACVVGLIAAVTLILIVIRGKLATDRPEVATGVPATIAPTWTAWVIAPNPDLEREQIIGLELDNELKRLGITSTAQAQTIVQAAIDAQAENETKRQELQGKLDTATVAAVYGDATATAIKRTQVAGTEQASAAFWANVTETETVNDALVAKATADEALSNAIAEQNRRLMAERWAGPLWVAGQLVWPLLVVGIFAILISISKRIGRDLQKPSVVLPEAWQPQEPAPVAPIRIEIGSNGGKTLQFMELPATPAQMRKLVDGALSDTPLSENEWCGRNPITGKHNPFSVREFRIIRETLMRAGLACWRDELTHEQGWVLSEQGRQAFEQMQGEVHTPHPTAEFTAN